MCDESGSKAFASGVNMQEIPYTSVCVIFSSGANLCFTLYIPHLAEVKNRLNPAGAVGLYIYFKAVVPSVSRRPRLAAAVDKTAELCYIYLRKIFRAISSVG